MSAPLNVSNKDQLFAADERRDCALCGCSLAEPGTTRFAKQGAHDPTPTPYFILENLFSELDFSEESHLLDVGCGTGRVLSFFIQSKLAGHATGIELDPDIAEYARNWSRRFTNVDVLCGSALETPLAPYTHLYLFNPFDTNVLMQFIMKIENEARHPITLVHMSDNGETYSYIGRTGWSLRSPGRFSGVPHGDGQSDYRICPSAALLDLEVRPRIVAIMTSVREQAQCERPARGRPRRNRWPRRLIGPNHDADAT